VKGATIPCKARLVANPFLTHCIHQNNIAGVPALPLPKVHHSLGPITLTQALSTLAGSPWRLVVDPIHRLISFQLPDYFQTETAPVKAAGTR